MPKSKPKSRTKNLTSNNNHRDKSNNRNEKGNRKIDQSESFLSQVIQTGIIVVLTAVVIALYNTYQEKYDKSRWCLNSAHYNSTARKASYEDSVGRPIAWLYGDADVAKWLDVVSTLNDIGFICGGADNDWDVLWTYHSPFEKPLDLRHVIINMTSYQKVNHFPGISCITEEVLDSSVLKYIPPTFVMPQNKHRFLQEKSNNPDKVWIEKKDGSSVVRNFQDLDLETEGTIIQEYITNPYLIGNHKFDITVYVMLTSVDPLRVYMLDTDWSLRIAPQEYSPIDYSNPRQYITDSYATPITAIPELKKLHIDMKHNTKQSIYAHLKYTDKHNPDKINDQIVDAVKEVFVAKQSILQKALLDYAKASLFFEFFKFDFTLDENVDVHLLNIKALPGDIVNEGADENTEHKEIYKQALHAGMSLTGLASVVPKSRNQSAEQVLEMKVRDCDIQAATDRCHLPQCKKCGTQECVLCHQCTTDDDRYMIKETYLEHMNRHLTRRVYPEPMTQEEAKTYDFHRDDHLPPRDRLIREWFRRKCVQEEYWCS